MKDIKSMPLTALQADIIALGEKSFRSKQIYQWMHQKLVTDFTAMTNLSAPLREYLQAHYRYTCLMPVQIQESAIDGTRKYLFALSDGNLVESVRMKYRHGNSVCISSQVGCRMGCAFCASAMDGLARSLTAGEMLEQIYAITRDTGERVSHVVVMGMGEPLDNYDNLLTFIRMLSDENGLCTSQRNLTVSTCGLVPELYRLAEERLQLTLALSLHAPTDEKRALLMPIAKRYPLTEVIAACNHYFKRTGRRITFEYSLMKNINDSDEDAKTLARLLAPLNCHVNLIPVNPVKERDFMPTNGKKLQEFKNKLEKYPINVTIRREMGRDIDGACGQLRRRHKGQITEEGNHAEFGCFD